MCASVQTGQVTIYIVRGFGLGGNGMFQHSVITGGQTGI